MPIEMPTYPGFTDCQFGLVTNTQVWQSPLTKTGQRVQLDGDLWTVVYSLPAMNRVQAAPWRAFLLRLRGRVNTFNAFDPDCRTPLGGAGGNPLVNGAGQGGSTLAIDGCTPNAVFLKASDYFSCNGELKMMIADAMADGSGNVTLEFEPSFRSSPPDNAAITTQRPTCTMVLIDDMQAKWNCDKNGVYPPKTFSAIEWIE